MSGALGPMSGPHGPAGTAASGAIPNAFVHMSTPAVINPDTFADVDGATCSITIDAATEAGSYTCKVQARKVSGTGDATASHIDISAMAMAVE